LGAYSSIPSGDVLSSAFPATGVEAVASKAAGGGGGGGGFYNTALRCSSM